MRKFYLILLLLVSTLNIIAQTKVNAGNDQTICKGQKATLTATGSDTYKWNTGDTTSSIIVSPASTTTYLVTGTTSGVTSTDNIVVYVNALPAINAGSDQTICQNALATLTATGANTYVWDNSVGTASIKVYPAVTTTYAVTGTGTNGCTASDNIVVFVKTLPVADAGSDKTICKGSKDTLKASGGGTYLCSTNATTANIVINPTVNTIYSVTVTVNGCTASGS
ncbi:MAG: hypothetical protein Q8880_02515, partial [Bacteroidota bacterium]|nr:hypothetical protein [Bacteroidota bacterium]